MQNKNAQFQDNTFRVFLIPCKTC